MKNEVKVGQVWMNRMDSGILLHVVSVSEIKNTVKGYVGNGKTLNYIYSQLDSYWELTDKSFTRVFFKKFSDGDVIAFLMDNEVNPSRIDSYMHIGQHSEASEDFPASLKGCTKEEYAPLKKELESIGYFLKVVKTPSKYMYSGH